MKKKITIVIIAVAVVLAALAALLIIRAARRGKVPQLDSVKERYVTLIEASPPINEILFGKGLPTYPRISDEMYTCDVQFREKDYKISYRVYENEVGKTVVQYQHYVVVSEESGSVHYDIVTGEMLAPDHESYRYVEKTKDVYEGYLHHDATTGYYYYSLPDEKEPSFYYTDEDEVYYEYCTVDCGFICTDDIKELAEQVYSDAYLGKVYESLFTGIANDEYANGIQYATYRDYVANGQSYLQKLNPTYVGQSEWLTLPTRRYDYDTMRIAKGSTAKRVVVEIESYIEGDEAGRITVKLAFALEGGEWFLDTPTY